MDTTAPGAQPGSSGPGGAPPHPTSGFFASIRRLDLTRGDDRWFAGVCSGLSARFGLDPLVWRALFAASVLLGGFGLLLYGAAWALLPERRDGRIHLEELIAGRFDAAIIGAAAMVVVGLGRGGTPFLWWGRDGGLFHGVFAAIATLFWIAVAVGIGFLVVHLARRSGPAAPAGPSGPYGPFPASPAPTSPAPTSTGPTSGAPTGTDPTSGAPTGTAPTSAGPAGPSAGYTSAATTPLAPVSTSAPPLTPGSTPTPDAAGWSAAGAGTDRSWRPTPGTAGGIPVTPPYAATRPVTPPAPPRPVRPRVLGPGAATTGTVVALVLLSSAALLAAHRTDHFDGPVLLTVLGITVVLAGLGIVVAGLRGRRSGSLGFLAIMAILVAGPAGVAAHDAWRWDGPAESRFAGDVTTTFTDRQSAADGFALGFGDARVDLAGVPMTDATLTVPLTIGAGDLTVVVPADAAVTASVELGAGRMEWDVDPGAAQGTDGVRLRDRTFTDVASTTRSPQLTLDIKAGAGNITVVREDS
ncbi:PspC domain-containing protein [Cellulomonas sp. HZM]|uniref:PspC domain-containing protein n=1 Tax=Cellulomonas sp. HZM TaxID=1454010 RepID=UPI0004937701|nr:PspC domain-containing protein [Cellulomonas sp. HZM]